MAHPRDYIASNNLQKSKVSCIIEEFTEDLANICGKCMDIGCGPGDVTKDILLSTLSSNVQIIGTDISKSMVEYAREKFSNEKQLQFDVLNIETKNLPEKYISEFDHIFSFYTLQWCSDIEQAYKNIYEMLRPNGTMLLYIVAQHDIYEILRSLARNIRFANYIPEAMKYVSPYHESKNARKEAKDVLQSIGFTVHHCSLREASYSEKKLEQFLNSIISILPFLDDMPHDLMEEFKNIFIHEYMKMKIQYKSMYDKQEFTLDLYKALIIYAKKIA